MSKAIEDVVNERKRQIEKEGYSELHDDEHDNFEMSDAAICYIDSAQHEGMTCDVSHAWPWDLKYWKPKSPRRDLVRAAALIIAEIERIDRMPTHTRAGDSDEQR